MDQSAATERVVDELFRDYCIRNNIVILRQLQSGMDGVDAPSSVFLVLDTDGLVKVYKELSPPEPNGSKVLPVDEGHLYEHFGPLPFLPRAYGVTYINDSLAFLRLEMCYGQTLANYVHPDNHLTTDEACSITRRLASALAALHAQGVLYLDMRPENVIVNESDLKLIDLGDARMVPHSDVVIETHCHDPRYVPPETAIEGEAGAPADIFRLGVMFYQLLTGEHPFAGIEVPELAWEIPYYSIKNSITPFRSNLAGEFNDERLEIVSQMLAFNPNHRPTAEEVVEALADSTPTPPIRHRNRKQTSGGGNVLFPARMGVPHQGHIDFMARILELGYDLTVALQMSYVLSPCDPLPKWLVLKMVGRSLAARGFDPKRVRFFCSPFFNTDTELRLHYAMMPGMENIVAVASGNTAVHAFFHGTLPIIDQRAVFGHEHEEYTVRSWGARLRQAIRDGDEATTNSLAASGVREILSFEELQRYCAITTPLEFVWGHKAWGRVYAVLSDESGMPLVHERVSAYSTPEETLIRALPKAAFVDPFARDSRITVYGGEQLLRFERAELDHRNNELVHFSLFSP